MLKQEDSIPLLKQVILALRRVLFESPITIQHIFQDNRCHQTALSCALKYLTLRTKAKLSYILHFSFYCDSRTPEHTLQPNGSEWAKASLSSLLLSLSCRSKAHTCEIVQSVSDPIKKGARIGATMKKYK